VKSAARRYGSLLPVQCDFPGSAINPADSIAATTQASSLSAVSPLAIFTLEPGDILATGSPAGVGAAKKPPVYLRSGDVVRVDIEGIGHIENRVVPEP
jgi:2-keto-4-pentenoate hydratase/2-oxohepta-3-ene-1,7-dioic acid hydratase in catechol pathway